MAEPVIIGRWMCEECGNRFDREKAGARPIRFCTQRCYHAHNRKHGGGGRFQRGQQAWNKGVRGTHFSPATEYKKGRRSEKWQPVGTENVRVDKNGKPRAWVKVAEPNKWKEKAIVVWEAKNGPVPEGLVIHHKDRDSLNDTPDNLQAMTRAAHIAEHRKELRR